MSEQSWKSAIITILTESKEPLHYHEITERILTRGLKTTSGATPDATVNAQIAASIKHDGTASPFLRVAKGIFTLRPNGALPPQLITEPEVETSADVIRAFGIHWQREHVVWRRQPRLYGRQQVAAKSVDFSGQRGVYVLSDHHTVVYVGRAIERALGQRLYEHTLDRLSGRWNRFSWFGFYGVSDAGKLTEEPLVPTLASIVSAFEAILIETLEPPQNRRRGDDFTGVEYIQDIDPELREQELQTTLRNIEQKLRQSQ
ncbi:MAG: HTH domain-containing protein [Verrucomicrobiota bacterium]|nr:HTH domain-containing protein [Verrucomicrobiota bacterium]